MQHRAEHSDGRRQRARRSVALATALAGATLLSALTGAPVPAQSAVPVGGPPVTGVGSSPDPGGSPGSSTSVSVVPVRAGVDPGPSSTTTIADPATAGTGTTTTAPNGSTTSGSTTTGTTTTTIPAALGAASVAELRTQITEALDAATAGRVGAYVVVDGLGAVYDRDADAGLLPASAQKLYVGAAALLRFGSDRRFTTRLRAEGPVSGGVLRGDLVLEASGDPSLRIADIRTLVTELGRVGIRSVTGALVLDDARFEAFRPLDGWKPTFVPGEVGLVSGFMIDGNRRYDLASSGGDVGLANLERLRSALAAKRIKVAGRSRRGTASSSSAVLASHSSPPMGQLVSTMLKQSENTYAEALLKHLGEGSAAAGVRAIAQQFDRFSLRSPVQVDGSGLSYLNRSSARQLVEWLQRTDGTGVATALRAALPVACTDGTMRGRLCGTPAAGALRAKTGALDYVASLVGYATTASGRTVTFGFLVNDVATAGRGRAAIDRAVSAIVSAAI